MKALKFFSTMLILLTMCIPVTSCSDDDEDEPAPVTNPEYTIKNTTWQSSISETDDDGDKWTYIYTLHFGESTATYSYEICLQYSSGMVTTMPVFNNTYTYTYKNNTAILTPANPDDDLAILSAAVTPGVQIVLTNTSNNEAIKTLFAI